MKYVLALSLLSYGLTYAPLAQANCIDHSTQELAYHLVDDPHLTNLRRLAQHQKAPLKWDDLCEYFSKKYADQGDGLADDVPWLKPVRDKARQYGVPFGPLMAALYEAAFKKTHGK